MARLPIPGSDDGKWGQILNEYLSQSLDNTGTLKPNTVGTSQLQDNAVTNAKLAPGAVTKTDVGLGSVDNTSDVDKPISNAAQAALDTKASASALATKLNTADLDIQTANNIADGGSATGTALSASQDTRATTPGTPIVNFNDARFQRKTTRRAVTSTGGGTSTVTSNPSKAQFWIPFRVPKSADSVQFRYHNYNAVTDAIGSQDVTLNVAIGVPAYDSTTGQLTGAFDTSTVAVSQIVTNQALAGGAAPFYSTAIPVASLPVKPGQIMLVTVHVATSAASGSRQWMRSNVFQWWKNEASITGWLAATPTVGSTSPMLGDFSMVSSCTSEEAILVVGDSYADGFGDTLANTIGGTHLSVAARLADLTGLPVASSAISGGLVKYFADRGDTNSTWEKIDFANSGYTSAVLLSHPNNDTVSSATVTTIQTDYLTVLGKLRAKGIGRIIGVTVPPRSNVSGLLGGAVSAGASTFTGDYNITSGSVQVGTDAKIETVTVTGSTGSGPYTMTISGAFAQSHAAGEVYAKSTDNEARRQAINYWLRGRPGGLVDVIDLDALYRDPANPRALVAAKSYDPVHISGAEYDNVARLIKNALV